MRKRGLAVLTAVCMLLSACGGKAPVNQGPLESPEASESQAEQGTQPGGEVQADEPQEREWILKETKLPNADAALSDALFEGAEVDIFDEQFKFAGETIYRTGQVALPTPEHDGMELQGWCVQTLEAPYTAWKSWLLPDDVWVEGEKCMPWKSCICSDGSVYMLLQGAESGYVGRWSPEEGCSAVKAESDFLQKSFFSGKFIQEWSTGEMPGYYFLYENYDNPGTFQTIYLDDQFQKQAWPLDVTEGLVGQITVNPFSGKTYLCGTTATGVEKTGEGWSMSTREGFTLWAEDGKMPVFTTEDVGLGIYGEDAVVFASETEGYLWAGNAVWRFSLED